MFVNIPAQMSLSDVVSSCDMGTLRILKDMVENQIETMCDEDPDLTVASDPEGFNHITGSKYIRDHAGVTLSEARQRYRNIQENARVEEVMHPNPKD